jgi:quinol monooxygenase YgiN
MKMIVISIPLPPTLGTMLAIARFQVPLQGAVNFRAELEAVKEVLAQAAGFKSGSVGQNLDEPTLWVLTTEWENVGSYRRALSSTRAKLEAIPVLARAIDEPGAYE